MASQLRNDVLSQATVQLGVWTDWDKGWITGLTLTTTSAGGAVLIVFLALFVQFTGNHSWGIISFLVHQARVRRAPQRALYHQQQVILRNASTADACVGFLTLGWVWRNKAHEPIGKSVPLFLLALVHLGTYLVAAIFSASASTSSGDAVLVSSQNCGTLDVSTTNLTGLGNTVFPYLTKSTEDSANYARSCYNRGGSEKATTNWHDCSSYATPRLPLNRVSNVTCPFAAEMCSATACQFDTGPIDSLNFGMNAPVRDRVTYRKTTTCAPLVVNGFSQIKKGSSIASNYTAPSDLPELEYIELYYGQTFYLSLNGLAVRNYTYRYRTFLVDFNYQNAGYFPNEYEYFLSHHNSYELIPIPQMNRSDGDINLVFLSQNSVVHNSPIDDPWYAAHTSPFNAIATSAENGDDGQVTENATIYFRDQPVSVLGCVEQYQICNTDLSICTPLTGVRQLVEAIDGLNLTIAQRAAAQILADASASTSIDQVLDALGTSALLATQSLVGSIQSPLPSNQWTLEVESWVNTELAQLQRAVLEHATGPANLNLLPYLSRASSAAEKELCQNQKARTTVAQNFSVLAIIIILVVGSLIICVDLSLDTVVRYLQRQHRTSDYRRLAWTTDGLLQLQRLAHEEIDFGDWDRCVNRVPVTLQGQSLAALDIQQPEHPRLQKKQIFTSHQQVASSVTKLTPILEPLGPVSSKDQHHLRHYRSAATL